MGTYLSTPITEKISSDQVGKHVAYGASSMQGWRVSQEDAHNCCIAFDEDVSLFAVYDGHGGHEVATYCARNLPDFIKNTEAYKNGDIKQALIDAFLGFDATLATPEVISILKDIAYKKDEEEEEENVNNLCMEASMPLEEIMAKYRSKIANPGERNVKSESSSSGQVCPIPCGRSRRSKEKAISMFSAGCSTSSMSWNTNEADVSSSSQQCGSSSSTSTTKDVKATAECLSSSEAEQVLDSTTSNGDIAHASPQIIETKAETKATEMPDSSADVKNSVSPSKTESAEKKVNNSEKNGENPSKATANVVGSSKMTGDSVSSSSSAPVENGGISSDRIKHKRMAFYQSLLRNDEEWDDDDDDDDENDETFDGVLESSEDDDTEDIEHEAECHNNESEDEEKEEYVDEDLDEESDEEEEEDDDDDDRLDMMRGSDEPGSDSGCTAVVAVLKGNELFVANAGDSRCVLCRDGLAEELSLDHKPEDKAEMDRIVTAGGRVTADGRVNGGLNLSRALGDHTYKKNTELPPPEQMISALPDIRHVSIIPEKDEFMILACDGIWNFMSSQNVVDFVRTRLKDDAKSISKICEELFDHCLAPNTLGDGTGCDNMTAVIVTFKPCKQSDVENASTKQSLSKKRPLSEDVPEKENDCATEECKRLKTETV